jgi:hypothetical protein
VNVVGVKIDDHEWRALRARLFELQDAFVKAGIVGEQATAEHGDATNAEIGAAHEFGTATIPQRSFIRQAFRAHKAEFQALAARLVRAVIMKTATVQQVLELLGAWAAGAIKATITSDGSFAPLAQSTIARKKSSKPLIDTGQLIGSITWVVVA